MKKHSKIAQATLECNEKLLYDLIIHNNII